MELLVGFIFAWLAVLLAFLLAAKYFIRKGAQKKWRAKAAFSRLNKLFKKLHIPLGIAFTAAGLLHGVFSSVSVLSFNVGTLCWFVSLLFGLNYLTRKIINKWKPWIVPHRAIAVALAAVLVWHVVDVGGIRIGDVWRMVHRQPQAAAAVPESSAPVPESSAPPETSPAPPDSMGTASGNEPPSPAPTPTPAPPSPEPKPEPILLDEVSLRDGDYDGTAKGYRNNITVRVTVSDGEITAIRITDISDDYAFYFHAEEIIKKKIFEDRTLGVDAVSGATRSSLGIQDAIRSALEEAMVAEEPSD